MRCLYRALAGATLILVPGTAAFATDAETTTAEQDAAQVVTVTGSREEYGVKKTISGTKTLTTLRNVPQAISVVSEAQIEDQSLRSVADLLIPLPSTGDTGWSSSTGR